MYRIFLSAFYILFICSCKGSGPPLPREKMEKVMLDVQLAEVYSSLMPQDSAAKATTAKNNDSLAIFYKEILAHHQVTAADFITSLDWYRAHPDELDSVFGKSIKVLDQWERSKLR